jgi:hypothetical protein
MTVLAIGVGTFGAILIGVLVAVWRPIGVTRMLRLVALALTAFVAMVLAPTFPSYLMGVPVLAVTLPFLAMLLRRLTALADVVGAVLLAGWGLIVAPSVGAAFLPSAGLLAAAAITSRDRRPWPLEAGPATATETATGDG